MNSGRNNMDQWLQQSAEMGNADFREADWKHMQQLLQPEKKRRFIVFWWLFGLLIGAGIIGVLLLNSSKQGEKHIFQTTKGNKETRKDKQEKPAIEKQVSKNQEGDKQDKSSEQMELMKDSVVLQPSSLNNSKQQKEKELGVKQKERLGTTLLHKKEKTVTVHKQLTLLQKATKPTFIKQKNKKSHEIFDEENQSEKSSSLIASTNGKVITINDSKETLIDPSIQQEKKFSKGLLANISLNLFNLGSQKKPETLLLPNNLKDSSSKKNDPQKKKTNNEWSFAAGYYTGNVPLKSSGINTRLGYSIKLGNFFVQPSIGASNLTPNEEQVHKQITIIPPTGTTTTTVKTTTTYFTPSNGFMLHPSLSIGWQAKHLKLYTGLQQNMVLNAANKTNKVQDTTLSFVVLPPGIVATKAYDASLFNGSKSLSLNIGIKYNIGRRWFANAEYSQLVDYNTAEGILAEKKKRVAFSLLVGIRF